MRSRRRPAARSRGTTFAIRARRRDKGWRLTSHELATAVGRAVQDEARPRRRSLEPGPRVHLEVDKQSCSRSPSASRGAAACQWESSVAMCLLSGGIDSPVAGYRAMKRGLRCDFVHFSGRPFTGPESIYKAYAQVARLDLPGWVAPVRRAVRRGAAGAGDGRRRSPAGDRPTAVDDANGVCAR